MVQCTLYVILRICVHFVPFLIMQSFKFPFMVNNGNRNNDVQCAVSAYSFNASSNKQMSEFEWIVWHWFQTVKSEMHLNRMLHSYSIACTVCNEIHTPSIGETLPYYHDIPTITVDYIFRWLSSLQSNLRFWAMRIIESSALNLMGE